MSRPTGAVLLFLVAVALAIAVGSASADTTLVTPDGTWTAHPGQSATFATAVQQPIDADGSSIFANNGKAVIPVKLQLTSGVGPFVFESILSDATTANDVSFLSFRPSAPLTFDQITGLTASYSWLVGDCHLGALRWSVTVRDGSNLRTLHIYYGVTPNLGNGGVGGCGGDAASGSDQSGVNLIALGATETTPGTGRFDLNQDFGGPFYGLHSEALAALDDLPVVSITLALDGGSAGDQRVALSSATIQTSGWTRTFTPQPASASSRTCALPPAEIRVTKTAGASSGPVDPTSAQRKDSDGNFRIVDCKYMYNLATSSLSGSGTYMVEAVIGGNAVAGPAIFRIR
jgi:hypothetical protein